MRRIYLGLHGALAPDTYSEGNRAINQLRTILGGQVMDWPAASTAYPPPGQISDKAGHYVGYLPTQAMRYLIAEIHAAEAANEPSSVRLYGWSTGAIMLCALARELGRCPEIARKERRRVDVCVAFDPLWSLEFFKVDPPEIPANVRRWVCVRQNADGDRPPPVPLPNDRFWQGMRLWPEKPKKTRYDEFNVANGDIVGNPGFTLFVNTAFQYPTNHPRVPVIAFDAALGILGSGSV